MIRVALVGWSEADWRIFRQEQWMAEVRRNPAAAGLPRIHFDVEEDPYRALVEDWEREALGSSRSSALEGLTRAGAIEVAPR